MELSFISINPITLFLSATLLLLLLNKLRSKKSGNSQKRPPGPPGWPVFGNMFELGDLPHQNLYNLRTKYGPVVWLRLGSVNTMVVQSAAAAAELFKKHDVPFADRKVPDALTVFDFSAKSLGMSTYGGHWRVLRRLCSMEFTVNKRMNETTDLRRRILDNLVTWIEEESTASRLSGGSGEVQLNRCLFLMAFNLVGNLMLSRDLIDSKDPEAREFFESMKKVLELAGTPNIADFLPILKWFDPLKIKKAMTNDMSRTLKISSKFVQERLKQRETGKDGKKKDLLETLLEYRGDGKDGPDSISEKNANIVILEMFFAGSESTSITIEWGFTELLRDPSILCKVREEIDRVVGRDRRVEESDMDNLPYLQAVVKETLRLHPALPLLLPRNTMEDTNYMGYLIPKDTQVFVNAWAIGRDPDSWEDPLVFKPERFLNSNIDFKGQHFELIPFGSGRRICIGFPLAQRVVHLALATLVQSFEWEFPNGMSPKTLDMEERLGLTLRRKNPIKVIPNRRLHVK